MSRVNGAEQYVLGLVTRVPALQKRSEGGGGLVVAKVSLFRPLA